MIQCRLQKHPQGWFNKKKNIDRGKAIPKPTIKLHPRNEYNLIIRFKKQNTCRYAVCKVLAHIGYTLCNLKYKQHRCLGLAAVLIGKVKYARAKLSLLGNPPPIRPQAFSAFSPLQALHLSCLSYMHNFHRNFYQSVYVEWQKSSTDNEATNMKDCPPSW